MIESSYANEATRQLAIRLLDKGSADQVLIGENWSDDLVEWLGDSAKLNQTTQLLVIIPDSANDTAVSALASFSGSWALVDVPDFAALANNIDFPGSRRLDQFPNLLNVRQQQGEVRISGGPEREIDDKTGIEWVEVCPGTFTMGLTEAETMETNWEDLSKPTHTVVLSKFQIAATEMSEEQYAKADPKTKATDSKLPKVEVNWQEARNACRAIDADLPTEAQWEYAARGGSHTRWSFGDDEGNWKVLHGIAAIPTAKHSQ